MNYPLPERRAGVAVSLTQMSKNKSKSQDSKGNSSAQNKPASPAPPNGGSKPPESTAQASPPVPPVKPPALFRRTDWLTAGVTTLLCFVGYMLTLSPDLTLQDSGELATGSFWAGVPHPPGYPLWTVWTWLFTELLPFGNVAWKVSVATAVSASVACGLLALMTSRGCSMILESIEEFKAIDRRLENALCVAAGWVAGTLLGFNGFMWSQAVIVEVYPFSVVSLMLVLVFLMRWIHAPEQRRYLYWAWFFFGVCFTNHQTLIVAAMGIEVAVLARDPRLGRDLFFWNSVFFLVGLGIKAFLSAGFLGNPAVFTMFLFIGTASIATTMWYGVKGTWEGKLAVLVVYLLIAAFIWVSWNAAVVEEAKQAALGATRSGAAMKFMMFFQVVAFSALLGVSFSGKGPERVCSHVGPAFIGLVLCSILGASFYFYMPLASMSNPPMNWGYARTIEGFIHALTRGQYEKTNPTTELQRWIDQLTMLKEGAMEEFTPVLLVLAVVPFLFLMRMKQREKAWLIGLASTYSCLAFILIFLLNPSPDRQTRELTKVFFTASHVMIAACIGYGIALVGAWLSQSYETRRRPFLLCLAAAAGLAMYHVIVVYSSGESLRLPPKNAFESLWELLTSLPAEPSQYWLDRFSAGFGLGWVALLVLGFVVARRKAPLSLLIGVLAIAPAQSIISHWFKNEQRGHMFGYWFGHDMFTPPFVSKKDGKLTYDPVERAERLKAGDKLVYPEMARDAVLFGGTDPGRFCPTYMIFCESFTPAKDKPRDPAFDRRDVYIITQNALADATYLMYIRAHFNRSTQKDPPFFQGAVNYFVGSIQDKLMGPLDFQLKMENKPHQTNNLERVVGFLGNIITPVVRPLDNVFTNLGDHIEKRRRVGDSFFKESDFLDAKGFAAKLSKHDDALSKFLFENLSKDTQQLLSSAPEDKRTRRALARDLNALMDNEFLAVHREEDLKPQLLAAEKDLSEIKLVANGTLVTPGPSLDAELRARNYWLKDNDGKDRLLKEFTVRLQTKRDALAKESERVSQVPRLYETNRFAGVKLSERLQRFIKENPTVHSRVRLDRLLLEEAYPKMFAASPGGVYPDLEIHTSSVADSQRAFNDYVDDVKRRLDHDRDKPTEPKQMKPGEEVRWDGMHLSVQGQVAVMAINGLLTSNIFAANPDHEFYVEESFPLDWMYPYLTPHGNIMKINRQPLAELTDEIIQRDHEFWSHYSERFIGNWITYDTPVSNICVWAEKVYDHHDYTGFTGDPAFIRDDDAQKAFSKLRSAVAGVYYWRINAHMGNPAAQQKMIKEAEFAFKQSFAFCPFSPEALFRFSNLLISMASMEAARGNVLGAKQHMADAIQISRTFLKLDPYNISARGLLDNLLEMNKQFERHGAAQQEARTKADQLATAAKANPTNVQNALALISVYIQMGQTNNALTEMDKVLTNPAADVGTLLGISSLYQQMGQEQRRIQAGQRAVQVGERALTHPNPDAQSLMLLAQAYASVPDTNNVRKLEVTMMRLNQIAPGNPEALYDLAAIQVALAKTNEAIMTLRQAIAYSDQRLAAAKTNTAGLNDIRKILSSDGRFQSLRGNPQFVQLVIPPQAAPQQPIRPPLLAPPK